VNAEAALGEVLRKGLYSRSEDLFSFSARLNDPDDMPLVGLNEYRSENNDAGPIQVSCPLIE